jgi:hypothetical protein
MKNLFKQIPIFWLKLSISSIALGVVGLRVAFPDIKIDIISLGLIILAFLPWCAELIESAKFPGGWEVKFKDHGIPKVPILLYQNRLKEVIRKRSFIELWRLLFNIIILIG